MLSGVAIRFGSVGGWAPAALLVALASVFVLAGQAHAQCQYDVTVLQFPINCGIGTVITSGLSLNENGAVVGRYKCPLSKYSQGLLWTAEGGFVGLQPPAGVIEVIPTDINDQGVICGTMIVDGVGFRGFVYDHGVWTVLPPVVDAVGAWSSAAAISDAGIVVGHRSITENLNPQNAYVWSAAEGFTDLGVMQGPSSFAADITDDASVGVGWTGNQTSSISDGFISQGQELTLLGPVPGGFTSRPAAVSNEGVVVGWGRIPKSGFPAGASRAFLWQADQFSMLGTLPMHALSAALGIRSHPQQIVGVSWNVDGNPNIANGFIWQNAVMMVLNDLIPPESGVLVLSAIAINEQGGITGQGHDEAGNVIGFVLTPAQGPLGDLNADCRVGVLDLLTLLTAWGTCPPTAPCSADLNGDGAVNVFDLILLLINWG